MNVNTIEIVWHLILAVAAIAMLRFLVKIHRNDSTAWAREIRRFDRLDREGGTPNDVIVFTGSSSIRRWKTLTADMAPLPVLNRGFGGAQIHDVVYYIEQAVLRYKPKAIVFYAGENDMAGLFFSRKKTPEEIRDGFRAFCKTIHASTPNTPIHFISIKPPKTRIACWPQMKIANQLIRDDCAIDKRLRYIDVVPLMSDSSGNPRHDLFALDGIHMNAKGYAIWTSIIKRELAESLSAQSK